MTLKIIKACFKYPIITVSLVLAIHQLGMGLGPNFLWGYHSQLTLKAGIICSDLGISLNTLTGIMSATCLLLIAGHQICVPFAKWLSKRYGEKFEEMVVKFRFLNHWEEKVKTRFFNQGKAEGIAEGQAQLLDQLVQEGELTPEARDRFAQKLAETPERSKAAKAEEENQILAMVEAAQHLSPEQRQAIQETLDPHQEKSNPKGKGKT